MKLKKTALSAVLVLALVVSLLPAFPFPAYAINSTVSSYEELKTAIEAANTDGTETTISIASDITIIETITIPNNAKVRLEGNGGSICSTATPAFRGGASNSPIQFSINNLSIDGDSAPTDLTGKSVILQVAGKNNIFNIFGDSQIKTNGAIMYGGRGAGGDLIIYGGTINARLTLSSAINCFIYPRDTIHITFSSVSTIKCVPQDGYTVTSATYNGTSILTDFNSGTDDNPYVISATEEISDISIAIGNGGVISASPTAGGGKTSGNVEYAWSYGGCITVDGEVFTISPYTSDSIKYVIDSVYVDGVERPVNDPTNALTVSDATSSVFASFAYTLTF